MAVRLGERSGKPNLVTIDMGGTSLDIGFVKDGETDVVLHTLIGQADSWSFAAMMAASRQAEAIFDARP